MSKEDKLVISELLRRSQLQTSDEETLADLIARTKVRISGEIRRLSHSNPYGTTHLTEPGMQASPREAAFKFGAGSPLNLCLEVDSFVDIPPIWPGADISPFQTSLNREECRQAHKKSFMISGDKPSLINDTDFEEYLRRCQSWTGLPMPISIEPHRHVHGVSEISISIETPSFNRRKATALGGPLFPILATDMKRIDATFEDWVRKSYHEACGMIPPVRHPTIDKWLLQAGLKDNDDIAVPTITYKEIRVHPDGSKDLDYLIHVPAGKHIAKAVHVRKWIGDLCTGLTIDVDVNQTASLTIHVPKNTLRVELSARSLTHRSQLSKWSPMSFLDLTQVIDADLARVFEPATPPTLNKKENTMNIQHLLALTNMTKKDDLTEFLAPESAMNEELKQVLREEEEKERKAAIVAAAKSVRELVVSANNHKALLVKRIRILRSQEKQAKEELISFERALAYAAETANYIPLVLLSNPSLTMLQDMVHDAARIEELKSIPKDWQPKSATPPAISSEVSENTSLTPAA